MDDSCIKGTSGVHYNRQIVFRICARGKYMKRAKNRWKQMVSLALAAAVTGSALDLSAITASATEVQEEDGTTDAETVTYEEEIIELPSLETSAEPIGMFSLSDGNVTLKDSNEVDWIDRIDLTDAECIREFYDTLVEASDHDGVDDYLIDDTYFNATGGNLIKVTSVTGTASTEAEVTEKSTEIANQYMPYVSAAYEAFDRDHPEVFWLSGQSCVAWGSRSQSAGSGYEYTVTLYFVLKSSDFDIRSVDYQSETAIEAGIETRDSRVSELLNAVSGESTYNKLAYFNEQLTTTNQYNTSSDLSAIGDDCRECISALIGKSGTEGPVCEAYARAFKVLCDKAGIPCVLVDGYASSTGVNGGAHMWNYAAINGKWYGVDVTWDDPTVSGQAAGTVKSGYENTNWFLVGADTLINNVAFLTSHPVSNQPASAGLSFTNGPVLQSESCQENVADLQTITFNDTLKTYSGDEATTEFTYGNTITVKMTPAVTDTDEDSEDASEEITDESEGNEIAIYQGTKQLTEAQSVTFGEKLTFDIDTVEAGFTPDDSSYTLTVKYTGNDSVLDHSENVKVTVSYLDTDAEAVISGEAGENGWYTSKVTFYAPTESTAAWELAASCGMDATWSSELNFSELSEDGTHDISYYMKNSDDSIAEKTVTIKIDTTAPVGSVELNHVTDQSAEIQLDVNDVTSGIASRTVTMKSGSGDPSIGEFAASTNTIQIANLDADTSYVFTVEVKDQAGNSYTKDVAFTTNASSGTTDEPATTPSDEETGETTTPSDGTAEDTTGDVSEDSETDNVPQKGVSLTDSKTKAVYKITKSGKTGGTVEYSKSTSKAAKTITIPSTVKIDGITYKVTSIGAKAFKGNKKITKVIIGSNITSIGKEAFYGCSKLKNITIKTTKLTSKKVGSKAFQGTYKKVKVKVPAKKLKTYKKLLKQKGISAKAKITK